MIAGWRSCGAINEFTARDVLFIDEIHRLAPAVEEVLYPAMEDFQLDLIIGEGPQRVRCALIAVFHSGWCNHSVRATYHPVARPVGIQMRMQFYNMDELSVILTQQAAKLALDLGPDGAAEIAGQTRGTPQVAGRLLRRVLILLLSRLLEPLPLKWQMLRYTALRWMRWP